MIRDGDRRRLKVRIDISPLRMNGAAPGRNEPPVDYYLFEIGTPVTVHHYFYQVQHDGVIDPSVDLLRVETDDGRVIHVWRTELDR